MIKEIVYSDREENKPTETIIDKTKEQETIPVAKKKPNLVLWGVIIVVIILIIVGLCYYINLVNKKKHGNTTA